jgi:hypothetical protein
MSAQGGMTIFIGMFLLFLVMFLGASAGDLEACSDCDNYFVKQVGNESITGNLTITDHLFGDKLYSPTDITFSPNASEFGLLTLRGYNDSITTPPLSVLSFRPVDYGTSALGAIMFDMANIQGQTGLYMGIGGLGGGGTMFIHNNDTGYGGILSSGAIYLMPRDGLFWPIEINVTPPSADVVTTTFTSIGPLFGQDNNIHFISNGDFNVFAEDEIAFYPSDDLDTALWITESGDDIVLDTTTGELVLGSQSNYVRPDNNKITSLGSPEYAWDNVYADDFINVASETKSIYVDPDDALAAIVAIRPDTGLIQSMTPGFDMPDYTSFPGEITQEFKVRTYNQTVTIYERRMTSCSGAFNDCIEEMVPVNVTETVSEVMPMSYVAGKDEIVEVHNVRSLLINIDYLNSAIQALEARVSALENP